MFGRKTATVSTTEAAFAAQGVAYGLFEDARGGLEQADRLHVQSVEEAEQAIKSENEFLAQVQRDHAEEVARQDAVKAEAVANRDRIARSVAKIDEILGA